MLLADCACDSNGQRRTLAERSATATIKPLRHRPQPRRLPLARSHNLIEFFFSKVKHFRTVATRYDDHTADYLALVQLAAPQIWMRF